MTQIDRSKFSTQTAKTDNLFSGCWIKWEALTLAERFVCTNIVFLPVWWVIGYWLMALFLPLGIVVYEFWQHGTLRLKRPSLPVVALLTFSAYQVAQAFVLRFFDSGGFAFKLQQAVLLSFCPAFLLWYVQSHKIGIRLKVVAWACTLSVIQMLCLWFVIQFFLPETFFLPGRPNLYALLTNQDLGGGYDIDALVPYTPRQFLGEDQNRFSMFFIAPEFFALASAYIGIIALDIKHRVWSWLLLFACVFLIFISATRMVFVAFPIAIALRHLMKIFGKPWGPAMLLGLAAIGSFAIFSFVPITDLVVDRVTGAIQAIAGMRAGSTNLRMEIYRQTWEAFKNNPLWGYGSEGAEVAGGTRVGSHSFILGSLLYQNGLVGTIIFTFFWISLLVWIYQNREGRPLTFFCVWFLYTIVSPTMPLVYDMPISPLFIVLSVIIRVPQLKPALNKYRFQKYFTVR